MRAIVRTRASSPYGDCIHVIENLTEIHWNYSTVPNDLRVAFESDIESTGQTFDMRDIQEMEIFDGIVNPGP